MKVRVWNDNINTDWKEKFKGEDLVIPKGKFIEMEFYDAHEFKGQYSPIKIRPDETQDPASFKMIRVEKVEAPAIDAYQCNLCKESFLDEDKLIKHSDAQHADRVVKDEMAEEYIPKKKMGRPPKVQEKQV